MTVLLTGGTGKTALQLASLLHAAGVPLILTSRSKEVPAPYQSVKFDWSDESTYATVFDGTGIDKVYLVAPSGTLDIFSPMKKFIDLAVSKGVKRLVLLSSSIIDENSPILGPVHKYLAHLGVDYCVLRPSWFMRTSDLLLC